MEDIACVRQDWLKQWMPKLTSDAVPITPYRVIWEFMNNVDPARAIVTHDSGSPRDQLMPFYQSGGPGRIWAGASPTGLEPGLDSTSVRNSPRPTNSWSTSWVTPHSG